jgi:hypothetical protein
MEALLWFLHKLPEYDSLKLLELDALKNDVATALLARHKEIPLAEHLAACYYDKKLDKVWREYCLQFMGRLYPGTDIQTKALLKHVLYDALKEEKKMAGTAILQLKNVLKAGDINKNELGELAYRLCVSENSSNVVKITAFQVAADCGYEKIEQLAADVLERKETPVMLKMSALAVLKKSSRRQEYRKVFEKFSKSSDYRLRRVARQAL